MPAACEAFRPYDFRGQAALVTGAACGIGFAVARLLAQLGATVGMVDIAADLAGAVADIVAAGARARGFAADVRDPAALAEAASALAREAPLTCCVAAAGVTSVEPAEDIPAEAWRRALEINLLGVYFTFRAVLAVLPPTGGSLVAISSASAFTGSGGGAHYAASKAGVHGLVRALARELGPRGVRVNAVAPRLIDTELLRESYCQRGISLEARAAQIPLRRLGRPEDVAWAAVFLASPAAAFITGQVLVVDGGAGLAV